MVWQYPELGWPELRVHPQYLIDDEDRAVLEIWRRSRGGMGGTAHLPEAGGVMDQAAATLASLDVMDAAYAAIEERFKGDRRGDRRGT